MAPVNTSNTAQTKTGILGVNELIANSVMIGTTSLPNNALLSVTGKVAAAEYCDENGGNCFNKASVQAPISISCPSGQAITAINPDGTTQCSSFEAPAQAGSTCQYRTTTVSHECGQSASCP